MYAHVLILSLLAAADPAAAESPDVCKLLTSQEIEAVQGEAVVHAKASSRRSTGLVFAHCFYALPTSTRSVSLQATLADPEAAEPESPVEHWRSVFHAEGQRKKDEALPIADLGDEAFWTSDSLVGALYVLQGDAFLRISLGGSDDDRRARSIELARKALTRL